MMRFQDIIEQYLDSDSYIHTYLICEGETQNKLKVNSFVSETENYLIITTTNEAEHLIIKNKIISIYSTVKPGVTFLN